MELNTLLISFQYLLTFQNVAILLVAFLSLFLYTLRTKRGALAQKRLLAKITTENENFKQKTEMLSNKNQELSDKNNTFKERFTKIIDIDNEVLKVLSEKQKFEKEIERLQEDYKTQEDNLAKKLSADKQDNTKMTNLLKAEYKKKKKVFNKLAKLVAIYDEEIELAELGFYKPRYNFDTSEKYKEQIAKVKTKQKKLVTNKEAIFCNTEWTIEGSRTKGRTQTNHNIRLTARAFNNECNDAISNVRWELKGTLPFDLDFSIHSLV